MQSLATDLWVDQQPLRFVGVEIGTRMTLIRLPTGGLWIHSPIEATDERLEVVFYDPATATLVATDLGWPSARPSTGSSHGLSNV